MSLRVSLVPVVLLSLLVAVPAVQAAPADAKAAQAAAGSNPRQPQPKVQQAKAAQEVEIDPTFEIYSFQIEGNTLFSSDKLNDLVDDLSGSRRTAADVEKARDILERFYHDAGYPTVVVNIPEQSAASGVIRLQVIESRIGATKVSGNRYYGSRQILDKVPSLAPGAILYLPAVQEEVSRVNRNPNLKVVPALEAGKAPYTVDVRLKAEDQRPWGGFLEVNNRYSPNTTQLRLSGGLHYDNLWNRDHSISAQYQMSPQDTTEVKVASATYSLPAPWNVDQNLLVYGVYSDSSSFALAEVGDMHTTGKGNIEGIRWTAPLPQAGDYTHSSVVGFDHKKFDEMTRQVGSATVVVRYPVEYYPISLAYAGTLTDSHGSTAFNALLNASFRISSDSDTVFDNKRAYARANYLYSVLGAERHQQLPWGTGLMIKVDGQVANQPLINNEEYSGGGMDTVRGYLESTALADDALHFTAEWSAPDLAPRLGLSSKNQIVPYLFYDLAHLWVLDPNPGQTSYFKLQGTGLGVRGFLVGSLEYQLDWGTALSEAGDAKKGDMKVDFRVKYQF